MDWHGRSWLKGCGLAGLLLLLAGMLSFDLHDPTITNLRYPGNGISNLAGLPGALVGGSLVELLGASSLWIPVLLANFMLNPLQHRNVGSYLLFGGSLILFSATLHGLLDARVMPGLTAPGLAGIAGSRWILRATGFNVAAPLLGVALGFALTQLVRLPLLAAALREGCKFAENKLRTAVTRTTMARVTARWSWLKSGPRLLGRVARARPDGPGRPELSGGALYHEAGPRPGRRGGSPGAAQSQPPAGAATPGSHPEQPTAAGGAVTAGGAMSGEDELDAWISALDKPVRETGPAEKP